MNNNLLYNPILRSILNPLRSVNSTRVPLPSISSFPFITPQTNNFQPIKFLFPPQSTNDLLEQIDYKIKMFLKTKLNITEARSIPLITDVAHIDEAKKIYTSALHIDIRGSSNIIKILPAEHALRIYQIFHYAVVETIRFSGGQTRTFAGDRIAALFDINKYKGQLRTQAVKTALLINKVINEKVNPIISSVYNYSLEFGIGIDFGELLVGRIGKPGAQNNDLVWLGEAMNYASKLADYGDSTGIFTSVDIYQHSLSDVKTVNQQWFPIKYNKELGDFYQLMDFS